MAREATGAILGLGASAFNSKGERSGLAGGIGKAISAVKDRSSGDSIKEKNNDEKDFKTDPGRANERAESVLNESGQSRFSHSASSTSACYGI